MRTRSVFVLPLLAAVSCTSPAPAPPAVDTQADVAAIQAVADQELQLAAADDPAAFGVVHTADVVIMPPNEPAISGPAAVSQWVNAFMAAVTVSNARYQHLETVVLGDVGIHRYSFSWTITPKAGGASVTETGKGIHIMQRQADGSWKITRDVWNTDAPAPAM